MQLSDGEKLILIMLADLHEKADVEDSVDPDFVRDAIYGGHHWALEWKMPGIFHGNQDSDVALKQTVDYLDMWHFVECSVEALSAEDQRKLEEDAEPFGADVQFRGFDGNNETQHMGIARFLVEKLGRFERFKGRDFNAHMPTLDGYARMLAVFEPIRHQLADGYLSVADLTTILLARRYPDNRP